MTIDALQSPSVEHSICVDSCPFVVPFVSPSWTRVLQDTYAFRPCELPGLPLMEVSSLITGRRGISLPFTDEVFVGDSQPSTINHNWVEYARSRRWKYIEFRGGTLDSSIRVHPCSSVVTPSATFYGHVLDLTPGEAALFAGLESSVARAIRKAQKAGVTAEILTSLDSVRSYYSLHCRTRRKHGLPPQPWKFFRNIHKHMIAEGQGLVALARLDRTPIAGALFLHVNREQPTTDNAALTTDNRPLTRIESIYKFGASDERFQSFRPNNMVIWEAIQYYAARGYTALRFGRTDTDTEGLRRFKLSWGTTEYPIHYWRYDLRRGQFVSSSQRLLGWRKHLFRWVPAGLSRLIGAIFYRHTA